MELYGLCCVYVLVYAYSFPPLKKITSEIGSVYNNYRNESSLNIKHFMYYEWTMDQSLFNNQLPNSKY